MPIDAIDAIDAYIYSGDPMDQLLRASFFRYSGRVRYTPYLRRSCALVFGRFFSFCFSCGHFSGHGTVAITIQSSNVVSYWY